MKLCLASLLLLVGCVIPDTALSLAYADTTGDERLVAFDYAPDVHVTLTLPAEEAFRPGKRIKLILFALPNGNSTAWTAGKKMEPGDDWHYGIQHIAAQTRFVRTTDTGAVYVLAYLETTGKSWPAWRRAHPDNPLLIAGLIDTIRHRFGGAAVDIMLTGHSGGGSMTFGFLNGVEAIPDDVERIAFLDSDYAYEDSLGHGEKLAAWLRASDRHVLCVIAYNDSIALLNGRTFVSPTGGTWYRSSMMRSRLCRYFQFNHASTPEMQSSRALDGRVQFLLKENPLKEVLHTILVARNGFIHACFAGTPHDERGYRFYGDPVYSNLIR